MEQHVLDTNVVKICLKLPQISNQLWLEKMNNIYKWIRALTTRCL